MTTVVKTRAKANKQETPTSPEAVVERAREVWERESVREARKAMAHLLRLQGIAECYYKGDAIDEGISEAFRGVITHIDEAILKLRDAMPLDPLILEPA